MKGIEFKEMKSVNRMELIDQLVERYGYTKKSATTLVSDFCDIVQYNMENGTNVSISGFGKFEVAELSPRRYYNPITKSMEVAKEVFWGMPISKAMEAINKYLPLL